ncbi:hypothetical protein QJS10_CPB18g01105 [Acorus calamus]|uniref:CASP-like protein n=1 Tax=Acorus calamus TaxID=4465 RepID=A0AAV9CLY9_ACOCL|nr:hypothetical protein QJS10_CPB18g01105 [Acorus calamus]
MVAAEEANIESGAGVAVATMEEEKRRLRMRTRDAAYGAAVRAACAAAAAVSMSMMVTAEESAELDLYGFRLPVSSKWSYSNSFVFLVGMTAATTAYSLLQLLLTMLGLLKKSKVTTNTFPSRNMAWLTFTLDQAFAYMMVSAGSAASGVTNLNRTGIRHSRLPDFCKPLRGFCDRTAIAISFAFLSCVLLAASAILDVLCLLNHHYRY